VRITNKKNMPNLHHQINTTTTWLVPRNEGDPGGEELRTMVTGHIVGLVRDEIKLALPPEQYEAVRGLFEEEPKQ
jgi:hypothetical protein